MMCNSDNRIDEVLAIIPARGGSKGVEKKNLRLLRGIPLVAHSIISAKQSKHVTRTVVSTDDSEIVRVAGVYGVESIDRPSEISGDGSPSEDALEHALRFLEETDGYIPDLVVFLQPTSPFRLPNDIDNTVELLMKENADSAFSSQVEHFTGRWRIGSDSKVMPINYQLDQRPRRQDYPVELVENGSIYVFRPEMFWKNGSRLGGEIVSYGMSPLRSLQIDAEVDLKTLEAIMEAAQRENDEK